MKAAAILVIFLVLLPLVPARGEADASLDQTWMTRGFTLTLETTPSTRAAADGNPSAPAPVVAVISSVTASAVTFRWMVGSVVEGAEFDRQSRLGPGGGSVLWVGEADVAARHAQIGRNGAILVLSTPLFHQFTAGAQNYYYSAVTGLLIRAEDLRTGSALVTTAHGFSEPPPLLETTAPGPVTYRQAVPVAANHGPIPVRELSAVCSGVVEGVLGGSGTCGEMHHWANADYAAVLEAEITPLAQGALRATFEDAAGTFLIVDCAAHLPAIYNFPPAPNTVVCKGLLLRASLPASQSAGMDVEFSHCLSPGYGFSCPWKGSLVLRGGITT